MKRLVSGTGSFLERAMKMYMQICMKRHDAIAWVLQWVMDSRTAWYAVLLATTLAYWIAEHDIFVFCFTGIVLMARIIAHVSDGKIQWNFTVALWEVTTWTYVVGAAISLIVGDRDGLIYQLGKTVIWIGWTYLIADLMQPPRKRKKIKVKLPVREKAPEFSFITI